MSASLEGVRLLVNGWEEFLSTVDDNLPHIIRRPRAAPLISNDELFHMAVGCSNEERSGSRHSSQVFHGAGELHADYFELLPKGDDLSLERYADRVNGALGEDSFTLFCYNPHVHNRAVFERLLPFIRDIQKAANGVGSRCFTDLFIGRYPVTPTGIHRDPTANLSFVVTGKKRYVFWKRDAFSNRSDPSIQLTSLRTTDFVGFLQDAYVLEAEAGDAMFWRSDHWHLATSPADEWVATFNIAVTQHVQLLDWFLAELGAALKRTQSEGHFALDSNLLCATDARAFRNLAAAQISRFDTESILDAMQHRWMERASVFGLESVPPPMLFDAALQDDDCVSLHPNMPVLYLQCGLDEVVAAGGFSAILPETRFIGELLSLLLAQPRLPVSEIRARISAETSVVSAALEFLRQVGAIRLVA